MESPLSAISSYYPRDQQNKLCKNKTWEMVHSKRTTTRNLLNQQSCHKTMELQRALWRKSLAVVKSKLRSAEVSGQFCGCGRVILLVLFHNIKRILMSSPGSSCTEIQKPKLGTLGFTQQQFSLFSEDLDAPKSISICYKCNTETADKPSFNVNPCSSYLKKLCQISSAVTLTQHFWIACSLTREVRIIKFECQEQ